MRVFRHVRHQVRPLLVAYKSSGGSSVPVIASLIRAQPELLTHRIIIWDYGETGPSVTSRSDADREDRSLHQSQNERSPLLRRLRRFQMFALTGLSTCEVFSLSRLDYWMR